MALIVFHQTQNDYCLSSFDLKKIKKILTVPKFATETAIKISIHVQGEQVLL
jgi:hypothetical protein